MTFIGAHPVASGGLDPQISLSPDSHWLRLLLDPCWHPTSVATFSKALQTLPSAWNTSKWTASADEPWSRALAHCGYARYTETLVMRTIRLLSARNTASQRPRMMASREAHIELASVRELI